VTAGIVFVIISSGTSVSSIRPIYLQDMTGPSDAAMTGPSVFIYFLKTHAILLYIIGSFKMTVKV
jgi:hypothetical protein